MVKNLIKIVKENKTTDEDLNKILGLTFINSKNEFKYTGPDHLLPADMIERPDHSILEDNGSINPCW